MTEQNKQFLELVLIYMNKTKVGIKTELIYVSNKTFMNTNQSSHWNYFFLLYFFTSLALRRRLCSFFSNFLYFFPNSINLNIPNLFNKPNHAICFFNWTNFYNLLIHWRNILTLFFLYKFYQNTNHIFLFFKSILFK